MRAFFGYPDGNPLRIGPVPGHVLDDQAADYDWDDVTNNSRVVFDSPDSGGFRTLNGGKIFVRAMHRHRPAPVACRAAPLSARSASRTNARTPASRPNAPPAARPLRVACPDTRHGGGVSPVARRHQRDHGWRARVVVKQSSNRVV